MEEEESAPLLLIFTRLPVFHGGLKKYSPPLASRCNNDEMDRGYPRKKYVQHPGKLNILEIVLR